MIEDVLAQAHALLDTLTYDSTTVALSALRTLSENQRHISPFAALLGVEVDEMGDGRAAASLTVHTHHLNPLGIAHGGVPYALADTAAGSAALSAVSGRFVVTQDMQYRYHAPARPGKLQAKAEVLHVGTRTVVTQAYVYQAEALIGSATATFAIVTLAKLAGTAEET